MTGLLQMEGKLDKMKINCVKWMIVLLLPPHNRMSYWLDLIQPIPKHCIQNILMDLIQPIPNISVALAEEHDGLVSNLTDEQRGVYNTIMTAVDGNHGGVFFLYGHDGTGKTFLWRTLSAAIRSRGEIVLNVASSAIAAILLPGGRTAHSKFVIPLNPEKDSSCNIKHGSHLAELIEKTRLIIWDEAPMMNKFCFEALDFTMRDLLKYTNPHAVNKPFGGKTVVFGGDYRQILPVIPGGTRQQIVYASLNSSYLWDNCK
ncbi:hypothetical protein OROHE_000452 [Orobanche hederae]